MKLLLLVLSLGFSSPEMHVDRVPQSSSVYSSCDSSDVAAAIHAGTKTPRNILYHYGKKDILMTDVAAKNIPKSDWDDFIMDDVTRFKLKRFRRGFYGTEFAEDADRFGDATYNWLVKITLKAECLDSSRVISLVYLDKSQAFQKWYQSKTRTLNFDQWKTKCFDSDHSPKYEAFVNYKNPKENADFAENECESIVADYYEEKKFAFIHDHAGDLVRSWAIRDRDCIANIEGTNQFWAKEFATKDELWANTCNRERNHRNNIRIWFNALVKSGVKITYIESFAKMIRTVKAPDDHLDWYTQEEDRFAAQDFADTLSFTAQRCEGREQNPLPAALLKIAKNVDQLQSSDVKKELESVCR